MGRFPRGSEQAQRDTALKLIAIHFAERIGGDVQGLLVKCPSRLPQ